MADVSFPRLEASCSHGPGAYLTGTRICTACLPADRLFGAERVAGLPSAEPVDGLPRPLGEQLTDVVRAALTTQVIAGDMTPTPDWVEAAARNIATVLLAEFDIDRRRIR